MLSKVNKSYIRNRKTLETIRDKTGGKNPNDYNGDNSEEEEVFHDVSNLKTQSDASTLRGSGKGKNNYISWILI